MDRKLPDVSRRQLLSGAVLAGAAAVGGPALLSACASSPAGSSAGSSLARPPALTAASDSLSASGASFPSFSWKRSLPIDSMSSGIGPIGGTELRALAAMDGVLYAGNGYWRDSRENDPALPGPQVLSLDAPTASWKIDLELDERIATGQRRYEAIGALYAVQFGSDRSGRPLRPPRPVLLASAWDRVGSLAVLAKDGPSGKWSRTNLVSSSPPGSQIRSFAFHRDSVTGIERVFAGTNPSGIFSGAYNPPGPGGILWDAKPEPGVTPTEKKQRVMSFAECDGKLYATVAWEIYERQDGPAPSWKKVFTWGNGLPLTGSGGLRGLTAVSGPPGSPGQGPALLVAAEGPQGRIVRISPREGFSSVTELDIVTALSKEWQTKVTALIVAYNDMTAYPDASGSGFLLIGGYDAKTPDSPSGLGSTRKAPGGFVLIRDSQGNYISREIADPAISPKPALVATRTMLRSPFRSDPPGTVYAGGFDAGNLKPHNSAWLYRGTPAAT